ncbi:unnamed protein product (macronuclear) [Paramecium tetraurelia]|uniref:Uncharacterized protein n=1 Tax=Paramecium tetraurelia TaxID=5888 RepID=A0DXZ4_PARTE|nr:uncharacterized protein GSPATT00021535001 [Paramecium tetraurelia]CAK87911.1 unnamed protein product [Paramecium tetraurelia]|eukprot:XP_001455308.1 hypothetical protein (macronuclear) [Paramecium tetraurelia strain d4-2]
MGSCAQCNTKSEVVESDMHQKHESVHTKLLELNQITMVTIFQRMKVNNKMEIDQLSDKVFEDSLKVSEVNQEITLIQSIHESLKRKQRQYSFQECMNVFNSSKRGLQKESINKLQIRMTDPNIPKNLSHSSSSNHQFREFNKQFKVSEKQHIEFEESIKSILKKTTLRNSESKSVHFARNTNSSQTQMKSRSCNHSKKKRKKIQQFDNYKF